MIRTLLVAALLCVVCSSANARSRHHHAASQRLEAVSQRLVGCSDPVMRPLSCEVAHLRNLNRMLRPKPMPSGLRRVMAEGAGRVVSHPSGCPARAFCGCGAAVRVFGKPIRSLWLAANWFRFPRAEPAPGTVAVRRHHVFVLERQISGSTWLVYDANSGRHRTRVHPRSIAGYVIVDPRTGA